MTSWPLIGLSALMEPGLNIETKEGLCFRNRTCYLGFFKVGRQVFIIQHRHTASESGNESVIHQSWTSSEPNIFLMESWPLFFIRQSIILARTVKMSDLNRTSRSVWRTTFKCSSFTPNSNNIPNVQNLSFKQHSSFGYS